MLTKIGLTNFKCFDNLELECRPLNLLCGLNGMGKSSVIQALLALRQSFESRDLLVGRLVLSGARADLGTGTDVLFDDAEEDVVGFTLQDSRVEDAWESDFGYSMEADQLVALVNGRGTHGLYLPIRWRGFPPFGGNMLYMSAERVGPRKLYPLSDSMARKSDFGPNGEYAWNYLISRQDRLLDTDDPRSAESGHRRLDDLVDRWLQDVSPGAHLRMEEVADADAIIAGFSFDRRGDVASRRYRATNVGFGLSYTLPVIIALLSHPGALCLIENPESHLHPRGQTKLAELAARAAKAGVQVFVETHSDHFMDGVRIAVRDGLIEPSDVAFHYFRRDGNRSVVSSPQVDKDGRLSEWPEGFFDQHEENLARLLAPRS